MGIDSHMEVMVGNAIRSIYQMIILVDGSTLECRMLDYNKEFHNISEVVNSFDLFIELLYQNIHPADRETFALFTDPAVYKEELSKQVSVSVNLRIRQSDNKYRWSEIVMCNALKEDSPEGNQYLFLVRDIHAGKIREIEKEAEELMVIKNLQDKYDTLFEENMKDAQTGCYNRKGLAYYSDYILKKAQSSGLYLFVCVADLNGLKYLNDTYGYGAGDEAIAEVSKELIKAAPKGSRIVRTGGDEFLIFAAIDKDSEEADLMSRKIEEGLSAYNMAHDNPYTIGASYGWVVMPYVEGMDNLDEYIEMADAKMYEMKVQRDEHRRD